MLCQTCKAVVRIVAKSGNCCLKKETVYNAFPYKVPPDNVP